MTSGDTVDYKIIFFHQFKSLEWDYFQSLSDDKKKLLRHDGRLENYNPCHLLECKYFLIIIQTIASYRNHLFFDEFIVMQEGKDCKLTVLSQGNSLTFFLSNLSAAAVRSLDIKHVESR